MLKSLKNLLNRYRYYSPMESNINLDLCVRTHDRWIVRKPRSGFTQDVFSAEVWLASAPLHEAGRTKKSASTLKAKLGIGQLAFVSDNSDAQFNAYLQILSSSKPHSEVASTTHTSALKSFRKDAPLFSGFIRPGVPTSKCGISKVG